MLEKFISQPKKLFLLDGLGATLSAFLLGVVLVKLERTFGIPSQSLYILATLPVIFVIYDLYCIRKTRTDEGPLLKGIALINLSYCCISIVFAFYHFSTITIYEWAYLLTEILMTIFLASIEFKVARALINNVPTKPH